MLVHLPDNRAFVGTRLPEAEWPLIHASAPGVAEVAGQDGEPSLVGYVPITGRLEGLYVAVTMAPQAPDGLPTAPIAAAGATAPR